MEEKVIQISGSITVDELANALGISVTHLIGELFKNGIMATINQRLDAETAQIMTEELGFTNVRFEKKENAEVYKKMATKCQESFTQKFYNKRRKCLYDVLGDSKIRPNQLFALSLSHPILDPKSDIAKEMFATVTKKLLNKTQSHFVRMVKNFADIVIIIILISEFFYIF